MPSGSSLWWRNQETCNILLEIHLHIRDHGSGKGSEDILKAPVLKRWTGEDRK
jgi:hypothetical protein